VIEDALTGGFGAMEIGADGRSGAACDAVAGGRASIRISTPSGTANEDSPRYAQAMPGQTAAQEIDLLDRQLMYVRMNPRSFNAVRAGTA